MEFIDLIEVVLETIPTYFGCLFTKDSPPDEEDVVEGRIPNVYPITYFSNKLIEKYKEQIIRLGPEINIEICRGRMITLSIKGILK